MSRPDAAGWVLTPRRGYHSAKPIPLAAGRDYTMGRSKECDIVLDERDKSASRMHARLSVGRGGAAIANLSRTNPVMVNGARTEQRTLAPGDTIQLGAAVFAVNAPAGGSSAAGAGKKGKTGKTGGQKLAILGVIGVCIAAALIVIMTRAPSPAPPAGSVSDRAESTADTPSSNPPLTGAPIASPELPNSGAAGDAYITEQDRQKAEEYFQMGMFFYEAGKLPKAIAEWRRALAVNYRHPRAHQWLLRAEEELGQMIEEQYQQGLMHEKYMRYDMAIDAFQSVLDLCAERKSQVCMDAFNHLNALKEKESYADTDNL